MNQRPDPQFAVGDWVYNEKAGHNVKLAAVVWSDLQQNWRYWMPGLGTPWPNREETDKPYGEYEQVRENCYRLVTLHPTKPEA